MNAIQPILDFVSTRQGATAIEQGDRRVTYGELAESIRRIANYLKGLGFERGDRIGLCLKDTPDHLIALLGVAYMGGVGVSLDWRARAHENARFVEALALSCVLAEPGARLAEGGTSTIALDEAWRQTVAAADDAGEAQGDDDDLFALSATSGSTGVPSFTVMTHRQYSFASAGMLELMGLSGPQRFLCTLPLYYSGGRNSCLAHLLRGDCVVLYPSLFHPDEYADVARRHSITVGTLVPTVVRQLLAAAGEGPMLPSLTKLFCTGAPLHPEEKRDAVKRLSPNFYERYGTAETLAISVLRPADLADRAQSVGHPHSLVKIEIVDEEDRLLPAGAMGRMRVRGPGLGSPLYALGNDAKFRDGAFYPGEIAHLDEAGYIFLHGRTSDVIMRSGTKIFPAEVERALAEHPDVQEVAVMGRTGSDNEEAVVAVVVRRRDLSTGELLAHCRARLTAHKVPQAIHFLDELPRNTAGKVDKPALMRRLNGEAS